jgi:hypothetical protein
MSVYIVYIVYGPWFCGFQDGPLNLRIWIVTYNLRESKDLQKPKAAYKIKILLELLGPEN